MKKRFILLFLCFQTLLSLSQDDESIPLIQFIEWLEKEQSVNFSYDTDLIKGISVNKKLKKVSFEKLNQLLEQVTGLLFKKNSNSQILIIPRKKINQVCGTVLDREGRNPLFGAIVYNKDKSKSIYSSENGDFNLGYDFSPNDIIFIEYLGYESKKIPARLFFGCKEIELNPTLNTLDEVIITSYMTQGVSINKTDHSLEISTSQVTQIPGEPQGDVLQAVQALPGINSASGKAGSINMRGGAVDQSLILIDDIPLFYRGHVFGTVSPFNPLMAEKINVYRSGPTVNYGGTVGGAVSIQTQGSVQDSAYYSMYASTSSLGIFTHQPIIKNKLSLYVSGRSSYFSDWQSPKLNAIATTGQLGTLYSYAEYTDSLEEKSLRYSFGDANLRLNYSPNDNTLISLSGLSYSDNLSNSILDHRSNEIVNEKFKTNNLGARLSWSQSWSKNISTSIKAVHSYYNNENFSIDGIGNPIKDKHSVKQTKIISELSFIPNKSTNRYHIGHEYSPLEATNSEEDTLNNIITNTKKNENQALYLSYELNSIKRLYANLGFRGTYIEQADYFIPEPRFFVSFDLSNNWFLKSSFSMQSQQITQTIYFDFDDLNSEDREWRAPDIKERIPISKQFMIGTFWKKKAWQIDLEMYYKKTQNIRTLFNLAPSPANILEGNTIGDGLSYGLDFMISRNTKSLSSWFTFSYTRTEWSFERISDNPIIAYYDQPLSFTLASSYKIKHFTLSSGFSIKSGLPNQVVNTGVNRLQTRPTPSNARINMHIPPSPTPPSSGPMNDIGVDYYGRLPIFHQLDVSMDYRFSNENSWKGNLGISILNVYNRKNTIENIDIRAFRINNLNRNTIGIAPEFYLKLSF